MVHGTIAAVEWKTRESWVGSCRVGSCRVGSCRVGLGRVGLGRVGSGRVGSGRVGSGRVGSGRFVWTPFLFDPSLTFFFAPPWLSRRLLCILFCYLNASDRLCYQSISCRKEKEKGCDAEYKSLLQILSTSQWWSHLLRKRNRELYKMKAITCRIHNNFNFHWGNVLQSNDDSAKTN